MMTQTAKPYSKTNRKIFEDLSDSEKEWARNLQYHEKMGRMDPVYFAEKHLGLTLHQGQKDYLRFSDPIYIKYHPEEVKQWNDTHRSKIGSGHKNILNPANRWGKTVTIAVKHIRYAYYKIPIQEVPSVWEGMRYQTLDISPHSTQVDACFNYILDILHSRLPIYPYGSNGQPDPSKRKVNNKCRIDFYTSHNSQKRQITYKTNSYFYGASTGEDQGASLAGKPFGYISYDECVQSHHLHEELFGRIFSRTMDWNAPVDLVSTADDQAKSQQYFYHLVRNADKGENDWWIMHGKLDDNVFIPKEILEESKQKLLKEDPLRYRQVVLGEFVPSNTKAFDIDTIENIWDKNIPEPLRRDLPNPVLAHSEYVGSVDWGFSDTGDPTIFTFFDVTTMPYKLVYHLVIQGGNPTACLGTLYGLWNHFNKAKIVMDTNAMGGIIIKKMIKDMSREMFNDVYDFTSHGGEKEDAIFRLKLLLSEGRKMVIEDGKIIEKNPNYGGIRSYYIAKLEDQLASYELEDKKLEQDFVVCLYQMAWYMAKRNRNQGTKTFIITRNNIKQYDPNQF